MLKLNYFLADIFILSAEKQPIKLSWRKIEWLQVRLVLQTRSKADGISFPKGRHFRHRIKYDKSEVVTNIRELTSKTIRWLYFRKRQPAFGRTIEQIIV